MLFVVIGWDAPDSREERPAVRPKHLEYWSDWDKAGKVIAGGPMTDFAGSLFIVDAADQAEAEAKIANDPYVAAGIFVRTEVHPYVKVLPTAAAPRA